MPCCKKESDAPIIATGAPTVRTSTRVCLTRRALRAPVVSTVVTITRAIAKPTVTPTRQRQAPTHARQYQSEPRIASVGCAPNRVEGKQEPNEHERLTGGDGGLVDAGTREKVERRVRGREGEDRKRDDHRRESAEKATARFEPG